MDDHPEREGALDADLDAGDVDGESPLAALRRLGEEEEEELLLDVAIEEVRANGPLRLEVLAGRLGVGVDQLDDLLMYTDNPLMFDRYERWFHVRDLVAGTVLTHTVTEEDLERGALPVDPDLALFVASEIDPFTLPDGGEVVLDLDEPEANGVLRGPARWLAGFEPGDLVAVGWDGELLSIERVDEVADPDDDLPASLRTILDEVRDRWVRPSFMEWNQLLVEHAVDHPDAFRIARPPLGEALQPAGLVIDGPHVFTDDEDPQATRQAVAVASVKERQPWIDDRLAEAVLTVASALRRPDAITDQPSARQVNAWLADVEAAKAVEVDLLGAYAFGLPTVVERLDDIERLVGARDLAAGAWWLRARCAEHDGDGPAVEHHLLGAMETDPDFEPALEDRADLLEDRGDVAGALKLLRHAGVRSDDPQFETLQELSRPGPLAAGRNEPCPCGSGRKYKVCCDRYRGWSRWDRLRWLLERLARFQHRPSQRHRILDIAGTFAVGDDADERRLEALDDPLVLGLALFEAEGLIAYRSLRGHLLSEDEASTIDDWLDERFDAYTVGEPDPGGEHVTLTPVRWGPPRRVRDRALRRLEPGTVVGTWLLPAYDEHVVGFAATVVPEPFVDDLVDTLDEAEDEWELPWLPVASWLETQSMLRRLVEQRA